MCWVAKRCNPTYVTNLIIFFYKDLEPYLDSQMDITDVIKRIASYVSSFEKNKDFNDARKAAEAICKVILLGVGTNDAEDKTKETKLNTLIESLTISRLDIPENHLRKIKDDLKRIQTYGNITAHDNGETLSSDEINRIDGALDNLLRNVFNSKEQIYIDQKLPTVIYQKITKSLIGDENWRCDKIISIVYPNREQYITKQEKDYSFYGLIDADSRKIGILFIGRNVCFKQIFENVLIAENLKDISSLTFLLPIEISTTTGEPVKNRKEYIEKKSREILTIIKANASIKYSYEFIEDYIWDRCLPAKAKKISTPPNQPYFIDQELHSDTLHLLSLNFVDSIVTNKLQEKKPIYLIFGDGGAGKTTFCDQAIQKVNEYQNKGLKKKAILLSSYDIPEHHLTSGIKVESLQNLYSIISENDEDSIDTQSLALNVSSGNLLIIIDGLDEIQSKLKERFVLEKFIESVIELNDTYLNCSVIITSREINKSVFERSDVDIFYLKGFDDALAQKYLSKRFLGDEKTITRAKENIATIGSNSNITPLIMRLICDLVGENSSKRSLEMTEKYFKNDSPLDKVVFQLIDREIEKQSLGISCDEYFEILRDIVFEYSGVVKKEDFDFLIELKLSNSVRSNKQDSFNNFYLSPLLSRNNEVFRINYDSLEFLIKARNLTYLINAKDSENNENILRTLAQDCYKGGVLVKEICKYKRKDTSYESNLIRNKILKNNGLDENCKRKLISALLYVIFEKTHSNRNYNSTIILDIFAVKQGGEIRGLSIYGEFYPLDFSLFTVKDGYFNNYSNLAKSNIPKGEKIFYSSHFLNIDKKEFGKDSIEKANFHDDCIICDELLSAIELSNENNEKKLDYLKNDLKRIFNVGYRSGSFSWTSKKVYIQHCTYLKSNITLENYLQFLQSKGFLIEENAEGSPEVGYRVCNKYMLDVKEFLSQSLISDSIEKLMQKLSDF